MALKKTVLTNFGVEIVDAYHRVEDVRIIGKNAIAYFVRSYKDRGFMHFSERQEISNYDIHGENPMEQAYSYLKTLSEFADAVDC